jgi:recombination protein RecA
MADQKKIDALVSSIEKSWGKGSFMKIDDNKTMDIEVISTGSLGLDIALGCYGYPRGRIVEIMGWESSGKSTLALHAVAETQKENLAAAYIDVEHSFDKDYAQKLGVIVEGENALFVSQPDFGEMALDIVDKVVSSNEFGVVVVDSVAALVTKAELEGEMGDSSMGTQARLMSKALRKLTATISRSNCLVIFINQYREKIGVMFGSPVTTTGGNALKFYASIRLEVTSSTQIKSGSGKEEDVIGKRVKVTVKKNKMAAPFKKCEFDLIFGEGISKMGEIVDMGVEMEIIKKSGSWFSYGDTKLGQGREGVIQLMNDNPEMVQEIEGKIKDKLFGEIEV